MCTFSAEKRLLLEDFYDFLKLFRVTLLVIADGVEPIVEIQIAEKGVLVAIGAQVASRSPGSVFGQQQKRALAKRLTAGERFGLVQQQRGVERDRSLALQDANRREFCR